MRSRKLVELVGRFVLTFAAVLLGASGVAGVLHRNLGPLTMAVLSVVACGTACFVVWERHRH